MTGSPEMRLWQTVLQRCNNPRAVAYPRYGGRGIRVCRRWRNFEHFFADMGPRPSPKHTLERVNNNVGYRPGNVIWCHDRRVQANNTVTNRFIVFAGQRKTVAQWCVILGLNHRTVRSRLHMGWSGVRALSTRIGHYAVTRRSRTM